MEHAHEEVVQIKLGGKIYTGSFSIGREMITVTYGPHSKKTQLGGSAGAPLSLARIMLRELVEEHGPPILAI